MIVPTIGPFTRPSPPRMSDRVGEERERRRVVVGLRPTAVPIGEHQPAEGADDAAEDEALHLVGEDVLAEGPGRVLVLADALEDPAPRAAHQGEGDQGDDPATMTQPMMMIHRWSPTNLTAPTLYSAAAASNGLRSSKPPVKPLMPSVPPGEPREAHRAQDEADDLGRGDGDDGQVVGAQAQGRRPRSRARTISAGPRRSGHADRSQP